jgi:SurA N-terminal domain
LAVEKNKMIRFFQTPGPLKKYLLGGILILICASVVWYLVPGGIGFSFGGLPADVVTQVGGTNITVDEVRQAAERMLQQDMPQGGADVERLLPLFAQQAAQRLIARQALVAEAKRVGLRVTQAALRDELQHGAYAATFFPGGIFIGQQEYDDFLLRNNLTPAQFEADVGNDILIRELQAMLDGSVSISVAEVRRKFILQNSQGAV